MRLILDPLDLKDQFQIKNEEGDVDQAISTGEGTFNHLNAHAQQAVEAVGEGLFRAWDKRTHENILPS